MTTLNLRALKLRAGEEYRDEHELGLEPLELGGERYLPVPEKIAAAVVVDRVASGNVFSLSFPVRLHGPCYRCLQDAVLDLDVSAREYQAENADSSEELSSPYVEDARLDLSAWARDALSLMLPDKILCRPECAGLCPVCGGDLNAEPHEHEEARDDPRWAALAELKDRL
jgi:DUF177 domain-containing protein